MKLSYLHLPSPVGNLNLIANDNSLLAILWENEKLNRVKLKGSEGMAADKKHPLLQATSIQLSDYFLKKRTTFDIPMDFSGTSFQENVWAALCDIPYGQTVSYAYIAKKIGRPKAVRAVGTAIGKNPLSIVVPCHRVIGSDGSLTGFAGGLTTKETLLQLERNR